MIQSMSMNRKQRRLQEKKQGKKPSAKAAGNIEKAAELKAQGMALKNAGDDAAALPFLRDALKLDNSLADVHFAIAMLARTKPALNIDIDVLNNSVRNKTLLKNSYHQILGVLKTRKQYKESLCCQEELCRLFPDDLDEQSSLALMLTMTDQKEKASVIVAELMQKLPENKKAKALFVNVSANVMFKEFHAVVKNAIQKCFDNIYEANLSQMYPAWISTVLFDPECTGLRIAETKIKENDLFTWLADAPENELAFLKDRFFLDGLRLLNLADPIMESFMTRTRKWVCLNLNNPEQIERVKFFSDFLMALGEQCFFNEYVYSQTDDEKQIIDRVIASIKDEDSAELSREYRISLISCYQPLYKVFDKQESLFEKLVNGTPDFAKLVKIQYLEPKEEERLKSNIKSFGAMENQVSKDVQNQYEENPYPRWTSVINFAAFDEQTSLTERVPEKHIKVLIAGCGTGRQALDTTAAYPAAQVTAIDLSRTSIAYAQRKANEAGLADRVTFYHADILSMADWDDEFDAIECSGVLHHMQDPFKGWRVLVDKLKPGGLFKIGLYSETARKAYIEGQNFAKENSFPPTLEGIRAFRESMLSLPTSNKMRELVVKSGDFYATSLVRDLIFHVQEHRMNLPQIKEMMDQLGLECANFIISDVVTMNRYDKMFPDDYKRSNMMNWHEFEQKFPLTFIGMYQFWCRKAG